MSAFRSAFTARAAMRGMSLIELMVAMVIGLVVLGAVTGIFLSSQQAYRATEGLGRAQESVQFGFELMARDLREAGGNPCDVNLPLANVADSTGANWWTNWAQPVRGFADAASVGGLAGSNAIQILSMGDGLANVTSQTGTVFTVDNAGLFQNNDVLMVCDMRQLAIFRAQSIVPASNTIDHGHAGNCSSSLNVLPAPCDAGAPPYIYSANAVISRLSGVRWFIAENGRGDGRSLFRVLNGGAREEMVEGVQDMRIQYLQGADSGGYVDAGSITNWQAVTSMRISLSTRSEANVGSTDNSRIIRNFEHVVNVRNRTP